MARYRQRSTLQKAGANSLPQKRKCGNLVAAAETLPGCSQSDYSKIWFGFKKKARGRKSATEPQGALRLSGTAKGAQPEMAVPLLVDLYGGAGGCRGDGFQAGGYGAG